MFSNVQYLCHVSSFIDLPHLKTMPTVFFFQEMEFDLLILSIYCI